AFIGHVILGFDVMADGTRLVNVTSHYEYDVAPACSGIRSLVATGAMAIIYSFMFFPRWWKRLVLIGSALPLAVLGNTVRLLTIVLAAEMFGQETGNRVHNSGFWSMLPYVPALLGLIFIGRWLEKKPDTPTATETSSASGTAANSPLPTP